MNSRFFRLVAVALALTAVSIPLAAAQAQVGTGATLTVQRGIVAVVRADGSAMQPASSGMVINVGDRVATVGKSSALVTFFEGSELELGEEATIILRDLRRSGSEYHITVEDVVGTTINRVNAFVNPNSVYSVQNPNGQVVALIRGSVVEFTQFAIGGTLVKANCTKDCVVIRSDQEVCQGKDFACSVDPAGGVGDDPGYSGGVVTEPTKDDGGGQDGPGGTIGG